MLWAMAVGAVVGDVAGDDVCENESEEDDEDDAEEEEHWNAVLALVKVVRFERRRVSGQQDDSCRDDKPRVLLMSVCGLGQMSRCESRTWSRSLSRSLSGSERVAVVPRMLKGAMGRDWAAMTGALVSGLTEEAMVRGVNA